MRALQGRAADRGRGGRGRGHARYAAARLRRADRQQSSCSTLTPSRWHGLRRGRAVPRLRRCGASAGSSDADGTPAPLPARPARGAAPITCRVLVPAGARAGRARRRCSCATTPAPADAALPATSWSRATALANARLAVGLRDGGIAGLALDGRPCWAAPGCTCATTPPTPGCTTSTTSPSPSRRSASPARLGGRGVRAAARARAAGGRARRLPRALDADSLHRGDPRCGWRSRCSGAERFKLLQLALELRPSPVRWTDGLAGGAVERTPGRAEWPVSGWSRVELGQRRARAGDPRRLLALARRPALAVDAAAQPEDGVGRRPVPRLRRPRVSADQGEHVFDLELHAGPGSARARSRRRGAPARRRRPCGDVHRRCDRPPWGNTARAPRGPADTRPRSSGPPPAPATAHRPDLANESRTPAPPAAAPPAGRRRPRPARPTALTPAQRLERLEVRPAELGFWLDGVARRLDGWTFDGEPIGARRPVAACDDGVHVWPTPGRPRRGVAGRRALLELDLGGEGLLPLRRRRHGALRPRPRAPRVRAARRAFALECDSSRGCRSASPTRTPASPSPASSDRAGARGLVRQLALVLETALELGADHHAAAPLAAARSRALRQLAGPGDRAYLARVALAGRRLRDVWALPAEHDTHPPGLDDAERAGPRARPPSRRSRPSSPALQRALPAGRLDRAHRPRAYRPRLALADRGDAAQGGAHLPHRRRSDGPLSGLPLQPVDRAVLRVARGGRSGAARAHQGEGRRRAVGADRRDVGRARHQHADAANPSSASSFTASATSTRRFGAPRTRRAGCPTASASRPRFRSSCAAPGSTASSPIKINWSERNSFPSRPLLVGGARWLARARAHLRQSRRRLQRLDRPARGASRRGGTIRTRRAIPRACCSSAGATAAAGPTEDMLQRIARSSPTFPAMPALRFVNVADWFAESRSGAGSARPAGVGRRDLSRVHRGTLTTQGRTKFLHRRAERDLDHRRDAGSMAAMLGAPIAPVAGAALAGAASQPVPRHHSRLEHPRGLRARRAELASVVRDAGDACRRAHLDAIAEGWSAGASEARPAGRESGPVGRGRCGSSCRASAAGRRRRSRAATSDRRRRTVPALRRRGHSRGDLAPPARLAVAAPTSSKTRSCASSSRPMAR